MKKTEEPGKKKEDGTYKKKWYPLLHLLLLILFLLMKFSDLSLFPDRESWTVAGRKLRHC